ncbi:hypothetical protein [Lacrimispora sp.]|uniref:hypothetical protein n=1 Tax=Lacrimispora sp. TaxID=2719234 RepID=UPI002FD8F55D
MDYDLNEIILLVENLVNLIRYTRPAGTRQEQYNQYLALLREIDQLEDVIDFLESQVKSDYRIGKITREEYKNIDRILDSLDDRLDRAEDLLEKIFGMS